MEQQQNIQQNETVVEVPAKKVVVGKFSLILPVADTMNNNHEYEGRMTRDEWNDMVYDEYKRNDRDIDNYMNLEWGEDVTVRKVRNGKLIKYRSENDRYYMGESEAYVLNPDWKPYTPPELEDKVNEGKMSVFILDIEPSTIDDDSVTEYKFWQSDSKKVRMDRDLDKKTMMKSLPDRDLVVKVADKKWARLHRCKIVKDYSDKQRPFNFAIIVESMSFINIFSTEDN